MINLNSLDISNLDRIQRFQCQDLRVLRDATVYYRQIAGENNKHLAIVLKKARRFLGHRYYKILECRWLNNYTLEETAKEIGVTRERVRQIEGKIHNFLYRADPLHTELRYLDKYHKIDKIDEKTK